MQLSLTTLNCPPTQQRLLDSLVLLYRRLESISKGEASFGGFIERGDLAEKFHLKLEKYPRLTMKFLPSDYNVLANYAQMSRADLLASATTPLERLAIAALWKQEDLGKIGYIAAGIVESASVGDSNITGSAAPVFRQFGRHLANPDAQPIADQHSLRAYRYLLNRDLSDSRHRLGTVKMEEVKSYVEWVRALSNCNVSSSRADQMYKFDRSMFSLGKATKFFIDAVVPTPKTNNVKKKGKKGG
ncbi:hypothetical protein [Pseudomonas pharyngis]|uniref:hypothetical protein n=1 Tax=Pseudomonas pharyngis TaxID=2892333 RepID=UPI001F3E562C|nr:hypothetical protein [Pseudomonas pharyngis]